MRHEGEVPNILLLLLEASSGGVEYSDVHSKIHPTET